MLEVEKLAQDDPEAVREFAHGCPNPLKSHLLAIVDDVEGS
ncbi:hypothetical protein [Halorientalis marina]|nr:hypothetical protein [Halorientalis marina]